MVHTFQAIPWIAVAGLVVITALHIFADGSMTSRPVKYAMLSIAFIVALTLLWIGGEAHRANCIREGNWDCSVLPWVNGDTPPITGNPFDHVGENPLDQLDEHIP